MSYSSDQVQSAIEEITVSTHFMYWGKPKQIYQLFTKTSRQMQHMVNVMYKRGPDEMIRRYSNKRIKRLIKHLENTEYLETWSFEHDGNKFDGLDLLNYLKERLVEKELLEL